MAEVFVETNWIVGVLAPAWFRDKEAIQILQQHREGKLRIRVAKIALLESRKVLKSKFPSRRLQETDEYNGWLTASYPEIATQLVEARLQAEREMDVYAQVWQDQLAELENELAEFMAPFDESAMDLEYRLFPPNLGLDPYDSAILSSVLAAARRLDAEGSVAQKYFWTRDKHMSKPEVLQLCKPLGLLIARGSIGEE